MNIDRIAREMVDVEPSADLEARIRARVRQVPPSLETTWWSWQVAVPVAVAAAVAVIAFAIRGSQSPARSPEALTVRVSPLPVPVMVPALELTAAQPATSAGRVASPSPGRNVAPVQLSAEELAWMERRLPPLDPVNALQVDRLQVDSIQPEPLAITPLTMTPVSTEGSGIERSNNR